MEIYHAPVFPRAYTRVLPSIIFDHCSRLAASLALLRKIWHMAAWRYLRPRPPYVNLHLRIIYIFLRTWSVANRMVKGDRLRYDTIAAIYFLITYKTGGGGGKKDTSLIYGRNEKWNELNIYQILERTYTYIYTYTVVFYRANSRLSQFRSYNVNESWNTIIGIEAVWISRDGRVEEAKEGREIR